jgi:general stress protein 26
MDRGKATFQEVSRELARRTYGVLSTITNDGRPHSTGVLYAATSENEPLLLYVCSDKKSRKARNITRNPSISFTVPVSRRFLRFVPPSSIQFQGTAKLVSLDESIRRAFGRSLVLRQVLGAAESSLDEPDGSCFIRITPDPFIFTYGLGVSVMELAKNMGGAMGKVEVPSSRRS